MIRRIGTDLWGHVALAKTGSIHLNQNLYSRTGPYGLALGLALARYKGVLSTQLASRLPDHRWSQFAAHCNEMIEESLGRLGAGYEDWLTSEFEAGKSDLRTAPRELARLRTLQLREYFQSSRSMLEASAAEPGRRLDDKKRVIAQFFWPYYFVRFKHAEEPDQMVTWLPGGDLISSNLLTSENGIVLYPSLNPSGGANPSPALNEAFDLFIKAGDVRQRGSETIPVGQVQSFFPERRNFGYTHDYLQSGPEASEWSDLYFLNISGFRINHHVSNDGHSVAGILYLCSPLQEFWLALIGCIEDSPEGDKDEDLFSKRIADAAERDETGECPRVIESPAIMTLVKIASDAWKAAAGDAISHNLKSALSGTLEDLLVETRKSGELEAAHVQSGGFAHDVKNWVIPLDGELWSLEQNRVLKTTEHQDALSRARTYALILMSVSLARQNISEWQKDGKSGSAPLLSALPPEDAKAIVSSAFEILLHLHAAANEASFTLDWAPRTELQSAIKKLIEYVKNATAVRPLGDFTASSNSNRSIFSNPYCLWPISFLREVAQNIRFDDITFGAVSDRVVKIAYGVTIEHDRVVLVIDQKQVERYKPENISFPNGLALANGLYGEKAAGIGFIDPGRWSKPVSEETTIKIDGKSYPAFTIDRKMVIEFF